MFFLKSKGSVTLISGFLLGLHFHLSSGFVSYSAVCSARNSGLNLLYYFWFYSSRIIKPEFCPIWLYEIHFNWGEYLLLQVLWSGLLKIFTWSVSPLVSSWLCFSWVTIAIPNAFITTYVLRSPNFTRSFDSSSEHQTHNPNFPLNMCNWKCHRSKNTNTVSLSSMLLLRHILLGPSSNCYRPYHPLRIWWQATWLFIVLATTLVFN